MPNQLRGLALPPAFPAVWLPPARERLPRMTAPARESDPESAERQARDAALVGRIAQGDHSACAELYDRFSRPLYTVALRVLGDQSEAEDVVHDVFLALWKNAADYDSSRGSAFSWAVTFARNRAIDRLRQRARRAELLEASFLAGDHVPASAPADSADELISRESATRVRAAVASLPPEQQRALHLAFFGGLTQQEIAAQLREPLGTVKARIRRGLLKLRDALARPHE